MGHSAVVKKRRKVKAELHVLAASSQRVRLLVEPRSALQALSLGWSANLGATKAVSEPPFHSVWPRSMAVPRRFSRMLLGSTETMERLAPSRKKSVGL